MLENTRRHTPHAGYPWSVDSRFPLIRARSLSSLLAPRAMGVEKTRSPVNRHSRSLGNRVRRVCAPPRRTRVFPRRTGKRGYRGHPTTIIDLPAILERLDRPPWLERSFLFRVTTGVLYCEIINSRMKTIPHPRVSEIRAKSKIVV